jgi:predicted DNA-binding protein (MmcQ/YjbR family)
VTGKERKAPPEEAQLIKRVQKICAGLPEVTVEKDGFGHTSFRVRKKTFVMIGSGMGHGSLSIKADLTTQDLLVKRGPYIRTPYIGQHGWVTVWGDDPIDWSEIPELIVDAYRASAPKRLLRDLDEAASTRT